MPCTIDATRHKAPPGGSGVVPCEGDSRHCSRFRGHTCQRPEIPSLRTSSRRSRSPQGRIDPSTSYATTPSDAHGGNTDWASTPPMSSPISMCPVPQSFTPFSTERWRHTVGYISEVTACALTHRRQSDHNAALTVFRCGSRLDPLIRCHGTLKERSTCISASGTCQICGPRVV